MAAKPKVNANTLAVRQERAVAAAKGEKYVKPASSLGKTPVNSATQKSRVDRATINKMAAEATARTEENKKAATDSEGNVGEYVTHLRPAKYVGNATAAAASGKTAKPATGQTAQIRKDRAEFKAKGQRYVRSNAGLSSEAKALRRNAGVNERLLNRRASQRAARAAKAANG